MGFLAERQIANPIVLSGDIHAFVVSGPHRVSADLASAVVASEFVVTSLSSDSPPEQYFETSRRLDPNLVLATGLYRGYIRMDIARDQLRADLIAMQIVKQPNGACRTPRSFVVESGKPAPTAA